MELICLQTWNKHYKLWPLKSSFQILDNPLEHCTCIFIHFFIQHLLNTYYVSGMYSLIYSKFIEYFVCARTIVRPTAISKTETIPANTEVTSKDLNCIFHIRHFATFYKIMHHHVLSALSASVVEREYIWDCIFYIGHVEIPLNRQRSHWVCLCTSGT